MDSDCYKVDVIHYINPHLIWVEVLNPKSCEEFVFEQIGIYGLLPSELTIDMNGAELKSQNRRCREWAQAAVLTMKKSLSGAKEVFFQPTHIDRRCSIFDDNIHKYGEIIIKSSNGTLTELSTALINSGFALFDVCIFHSELSLGNLRTKLNYEQTEDVVRHLMAENTPKLKKDREKKIKKQTCVFQAAQNFEAELTSKNLERYNRQLKSADLYNILEKKMKDLDACKDVDEVSLGRANIKKSQPEEKKVPSLLKKKLELAKLQKTKNLLKDHKLNQEAKKISKSDLENKYRNTPSDISDTTTDSKHVHDEGVQRSEEHSFIKAKIATKRAKKSPKIKIPEYDVAIENRVAYGPPGINKITLPLKVVSKYADEEINNLVSETDNRKEITPKDMEPFDNVDSNVNIQISNRNILKEISSEQNKHTDDYINKPAESNDTEVTTRFTMLQKKLALHKQKTARKSHSSVTSHSDTTVKDSSTSFEEIHPNRNRKKSGDSQCDYLDSDDDVTQIIDKINCEYGVTKNKIKIDPPKEVKIVNHYKNNVNPFKNIDDSISVFVDKLVTPVLMVHTKMDKRIEPTLNIRDVNFNTHIHVVLKNMSIERPMMLQMVSWPVILRGFSLFMISPLGSGKTLGYLPAVCRLITDYSSDNNSVGPICIIVCATAQSVSEVEQLARMFLGLHEKVVSCYAGVDELKITTSLLNGADLFICTPRVLTRLLQMTDFGIDLRRLSTFVIEDGERLGLVYLNEVKYFLVKIKEMYKSRVNKEHLVQFIVASRIWCDFMDSFARKAPNSVICIGAFQECVLYSKTHTSVDFVRKDNKVNGVLDFLKEVDTTKRIVIVCRGDGEVDELGKILKSRKYVVFICNSTMTVEDLYNLSKSWADYTEPLLGPILICCDDNLMHLNITNASYLVHYSLPLLYSMFCKRFSVLNDNYSSIFKEQNGNCKIKVFIEDTNAEQLPKILNFIKRCTNDVPEFLGKVCENIMKEKEVIKAKNLIPVCDSLLTLGECPDIWACVERHAIFNEFDQPKKWMPTRGMVTFKILHYHSAVHYSARLLSNTTEGYTTKYPQAYSTLSLKMGMYFSKESNQKLHGVPKIGDVCAVSIKQNFYARCQVLKTLTYYDNGTPSCVLIKLIDEEKLEKTKDIYLFHLPDELKNIETHIVQVRLANIGPKDNDVTFSQLAKDELKKITDKDEDLYMRGQVVMTIGQSIFIDSLDVCQELTSLNENVVMFNFKKKLLEKHGATNDGHLLKLRSLCDFDCNEAKVDGIKVTNEKKQQAIPQWAHLENDFCTILLSYVENPGTFFVRLTKFEPCMRLLLKEVDKYVEENPIPVNDVKKGDIVLGKFFDDDTYERMRIDDILDNNKVKCFSVDQGDYQEVLITDLLQIPDKLITQVPFQAIECRLIAVQPVGEYWTEFGTNWFYDKCFEDENGKIKQLYIKYFTKEKAGFTHGHKYGVALIDTTTDRDELVNQLMIELNLVQGNEEIHYLDGLLKSNKNELDSEPDETEAQQVEEVNGKDINNSDSSELKALLPFNSNNNQESANNIFMKAPIRSVPLVDSDDEFTNRDWDIANQVDVFKTLFPDLLQRRNAGVKDESSSNFKETTPRLLETANKVLSSDMTNNSASKMVVNAVSNTNKKLLEKQPNLHSENASVSRVSNEVSPVCSVLNKKSFPKIKVNIDELRKPKLVWRQNKSTVFLKIMLIGAEKYDLDIKERSINFSASVDDTNYGFEFDLYGVVDCETSTHSNKIQYILIKLVKIMKKNWLTLTRDSGLKKWIIYDVDNLDTSSDEEDIPINPFTEVVKNIHNRDRDSDSDDEFLDDINYEYKRDSD